jgi:hypothetical protein
VTVVPISPDDDRQLSRLPALALIVIAVVAFVSLRPGEKGEGRSADASASADTEKPADDRRADASASADSDKAGRRPGTGRQTDCRADAKRHTRDRSRGATCSRPAGATCSRRSSQR